MNKLGLPSILGIFAYVEEPLVIIRRIVSSFKKQDWFVTIIEVLIVVIGIFLGLQVNDWNDERKASNEEQLYLATLKNDLTSSVERIDRTLIGKESIKSSLMALAALETKDFESFDEKVLDKLILEGLFETGVHIIERDLYSNMKSMGKFSLIKSDELQNQIIKIGYLTANFNRIELDFANMQFQNMDPHLLKNYPLRRSAQFDEKSADFFSQETNEPFDYENFILSRKSQNLMFAKFYIGNASINEIFALRKGFTDAIELIEYELMQ